MNGLSLFSGGSIGELAFKETVHGEIDCFFLKEALNIGYD